MAHPGTSYTTFLIVAAFAGLGRRQLRLIDDQYQRLLSAAVQGLGAGPERRWRQHRRRRSSRSIGLLVIATVGNRSPAPGLRCLPGADRAGRGRRRAVHGQPHQPASDARLDDRRSGAPRFVADLAALHRHVRIVHRLQLRLRPGAADQLPGRAVARRPGHPRDDRTGSLHAAQIAFIGPLLGSLSRPFGGKLADRFGGGKVTLYTLRGHDRRRRRSSWWPARSTTPPPGTGIRRHHGRLRRRLHRAVRALRHRKWLHLQDDPVDLRGQVARPGQAQCSRAAGMVAEDVGRADRHRRRHRRPRRGRHQHRAAGVLPVAGEIRDDGVLGVPRPSTCCARSITWAGLRAHARRRRTTPIEHRRPPRSTTRR